MAKIMRKEGNALSKIQLLQIIAVITLVIFVFISYQRDTTITWLLYLIAIINIGLWILRLLERRKTDKVNG
jgi:ABC-type proline/glycine betaine transport system permease subunit